MYPLISPLSDNSIKHGEIWDPGKYEAGGGREGFPKWLSQGRLSQVPSLSHFVPLIGRDTNNEKAWQRGEGVGVGARALQNLIVA